MANEKRIRANNLGGLLGAGVSSAVGQIDLGALLPAAATPDATSHLPIFLEAGTPNEEIVYIVGGVITGTTYPCSKGREGTADIAHTSLPVAWDHGPTARDFPKSAFTSVAAAGTITDTTAYHEPTNVCRVTVKAFVGDVVRIGTGVRWGATASQMRADVVTLISGSIVSYVSGNGQGGTGISGLGAYNSNAFQERGADIMYQVVAGDIDTNGMVTFAWVYKNTSATARGPVDTLHLNATNLGPQEA